MVLESIRNILSNPSFIRGIKMSEISNKQLRKFIKDNFSYYDGQMNWKWIDGYIGIYSKVLARKFKEILKDE